MSALGQGQEDGQDSDGGHGGNGKPEAPQQELVLIYTFCTPREVTDPAGVGLDPSLPSGLGGGIRVSSRFLEERGSSCRAGRCRKCRGDAVGRVVLFAVCIADLPRCGGISTGGSKAAWPGGQRAGSVRRGTCSTLFCSTLLLEPWLC